MEKSEKKTKKAAKKAAEAFTTKDSLKSDPSGSYTGRPEDRRDVPVQDADDL